jgi:hypothetical protein
MLHEIDQNIEPLGFKRTQDAPATEFITLRIEFVFFEDIYHILTPPGSEYIEPQRARAKVSPKPWNWAKAHEMGCCFPVGASP